MIHHLQGGHLLAIFQPNPKEESLMIWTNILERTLRKCDDDMNLIELPKLPLTGDVPSFDLLHTAYHKHLTTMERHC